MQRAKYAFEFKPEAAKQVIYISHAVVDVAYRRDGLRLSLTKPIGCTEHISGAWVKSIAEWHEEQQVSCAPRERAELCFEVVLKT